MRKPILGPAAPNDTLKPDDRAANATIVFSYMHGYYSTADTYVMY